MLKGMQRRCLCRWLAIERLEQPHMKHIMNPSPCRKHQPVGDVPNAFRDLKGTKELRPKLAATLHLKRDRGTMQETQPNPLTNCKLNRTVASVINRLVMLLSLLQPVPDLSQKLIPFSHSMVHRWQPSIPKCIRTNRRGRAPIDNLERRSLEGLLVR
jgi:hypothetical protein